MPLSADRNASAAMGTLLTPNLLHGVGPTAASASCHSHVWNSASATKRAPLAHSRPNRTTSRLGHILRALGVPTCPSHPESTVGDVVTVSSQLGLADRRLGQTTHPASHPPLRYPGPVLIDEGSVCAPERRRAYEKRRSPSSFQEWTTWEDGRFLSSLTWGTAVLRRQSDRLPEGDCHRSRNDRHRPHWQC